MTDMLEILLDGIKLIRECLRDESVEEFMIRINRLFATNIIDEYDHLMFYMHSILADRPRTDIYKVQNDFKTIIEDSGWEEIYSYGKFCSPWLLNIMFQDGSTTVVSHCIINEVHCFYEMFNPVNDLNYYSNVYCLSKNDELRSSTNDKNASGRIAWILGLFSMMQTKKYLNVSGGNGKKKSKSLWQQASKVVTYTIHLNEEGKRYCAKQKLPTTNTHWKQGKEQMEIPIESFKRHYHVGKGRTKVIEKVIYQHIRDQWVLPQDSITKVSA